MLDAIAMCLSLAFVAGCMTIGRTYERSLPVPLPAGAPGTWRRENMAQLKVKDLTVDLASWDAVRPGQPAPPLVLFLRIDPSKTGFAFDPMEVSLEVPGQVAAYPLHFMGPANTGYEGFGTDSCQESSTSPFKPPKPSEPLYRFRSEGAVLPLSTKRVCFVLVFDTQVRVLEPTTLHFAGVTRDGHPVDLPRVQLSRRKGKVISGPTPSLRSSLEGLTHQTQ